MNLENLSLSEKTKKNLSQNGYENLTDIQQKVIPSILAGKDIIAQSQTGSGKTAAFLIPILEKLSTISEPQAIILTPTRELARQVSEEAKKLSPQQQEKVNFRIVTICGGGESAYRQLRNFQRGVDIIVATPGRIIDHLEKRSFKTTHLKFLVLDEVDEMISQGFLPQVEKILKKLPSNLQILLFSATISEEVKNFAKRFLKNPQLIISEQKQEKENNIQQYYLETSPQEKKQFLVNLLLYHLKEKETALIFANQKYRVEELGEGLKRIWKRELVNNEKSKKNLTSLKVDYISSNFRNNVRTRILDKFKNKQVFTLISTDVLGRGIHVDNIDYVINYDFPQDPEAYIHRIGRTGRAGKIGKAITFVTPEEKRKLLAISRKRKLEIKKLTEIGC